MLPLAISYNMALITKMGTRTETMMVILTKFEVLVMMIMMKIKLLQHKMLSLMLHKFKIQVLHLLLRLWVPWKCWARSLRDFKIRSRHSLTLWVNKLPLWITKLELVESMMSSSLPIRVLRNHSIPKSCIIISSCIFIHQCTCAFIVVIPFLILFDDDKEGENVRIDDVVALLGLVFCVEY